jgi:hypothetical protein
MSEEEAVWWGLANIKEGLRGNIFTIEDLLKAFEKLKVNGVEGPYRVVVRDEGFYSGEVPSQEEYKEGMLDRKGEMFPLNLWDHVE